MDLDEVQYFVENPAGPCGALAEPVLVGVGHRLESAKQGDIVWFEYAGVLEK